MTKAKNKPVKIHRAPDVRMLVRNKFYINGEAFPGDVVVGYCEKHSPVRWINISEIEFVYGKLADEMNKEQNSYIPCHPPLLTRGVVAMKRKDGRYIIIAGTVPKTGDRVQAHVFHERELHKGKMAETYLAQSKYMENMTPNEVSSISQLAYDVRQQEKAKLAAFKDL